MSRPLWRRLLDLPIDHVPHFILFNDWEAALALWARGRSLFFQGVNDPAAAWTRNGEHYILGGKSPREGNHVVVAHNGQIAWDPHPSRSGLVTQTAVYRLVPM